MPGFRHTDVKVNNVLVLNNPARELVPPEEPFIDVTLRPGVRLVIRPIDVGGFLPTLTDFGMASATDPLVGPRQRTNNDIVQLFATMRRSRWLDHLSFEPHTLDSDSPEAVVDVLTRVTGFEDLITRG